jgi:hypothetical protein
VEVKPHAHAWPVDHGHTPGAAPGTVFLDEVTHILWMTQDGEWWVPYTEDEDGNPMQELPSQFWGEHGIG